MFKQRFLLLFLIVVLMGSSPAFAVAKPTEESLFKKSLELSSKNKFAASSRILVYLLKKNPQKGLYWFNLGTCYFGAKAYDRAMMAFGKVISLQSPLVPAAKLYQAKTLTQLGKLSEAKTMLEQILQENPPVGIQQEAKKDLEALTLESYKQENYAETEQSLKKIGPELSAEGRLLLGLSLAKQNKNSQAERVLKSVAASPALSGENQALARSLLDTVRDDEIPYWLFMDFSYGSAGNIYMDGRSTSPLTSAVTRAQFEIGYHFNQRRKWSEKITYGYSNETLTEASEMGTQSHTLIASLLYQSSAWGATLNPYLQNEIWSRTTVSQKTGIALETNYKLKSADDVGIEFRTEKQQAQASNYQYLTGSSYWLRPYYEVGMKYALLQLQWLAGVDGTQDIIYADSSRLPLTQTYQGPGLRLQWRPTELTILGLYLSRIERVFKNTSLPNGTQRLDSETDVKVKFAYSFSARLRTYALLEYVSNVSSLEAGDVRDKNYNATTTSLGISWDVF